MKYIKRLVRKLNNRKGFSLTELLACTLIMVIATSILTGTVSLAARHYDEQIQKSEADVLCESIAYALREKLSYVYKYDSNSKRFYSTSSDMGYYAFTIGSAEVSTPKAHNELFLRYYATPKDTTGTPYQLVSTASYIGGKYSAYIQDGGITFSNNTFNVTVQVKESKSGGKVLSEIQFIVNPFVSEIPDIK